MYIQDGYTALKLASRYGHQGIVDLLERAREQRIAANPVLSTSQSSSTTSERGETEEVNTAAAATTVSSSSSESLSSADDLKLNEVLKSAGFSSNKAKKYSTLLVQNDCTDVWLMNLMRRRGETALIDKLKVLGMSDEDDVDTFVYHLKQQVEQNTISPLPPPPLSPSPHRDRDQQMVQFQVNRSDLHVVLPQCCK